MIVENYPGELGTKFVNWMLELVNQNERMRPNTRLLFAALALSISSSSLAQLDELTIEEIAYRDSIKALNEDNAAIASSQEAYNRGIALFDQEKYGAAIEEFRKSLEFDPRFTAAYYNKGVAENKSEKYADGVKTLTRLIELKSNYSKAYFQRGLSYQGLNKYSEAEADYEKSLNLDATNPKAYYNFGTLRFLQKDYEGALKYFTKTLELDKNNVNALNDRGSSYRMLGKYPQAIAD